MLTLLRCVFFVFPWSSAMSHSSGLRISSHSFSASIFVDSIWCSNPCLPSLQSNSSPFTSGSFSVSCFFAFFWILGSMHLHNSHSSSTPGLCCVSTSSSDGRGFDNTRGFFSVTAGFGNTPNPNCNATRIRFGRFNQSRAAFEMVLLPKRFVADSVSSFSDAFFPADFDFGVLNNWNSSSFVSSFFTSFGSSLVNTSDIIIPLFIPPSSSTDRTFAPSAVFARTNSILFR